VVPIWAWFFKENCVPDCNANKTIQLNVLSGLCFVGVLSKPHVLSNDEIGIILYDNNNNYLMV